MEWNLYNFERLFDVIKSFSFNWNDKLLIDFQDFMFPRIELTVGI